MLTTLKCAKRFHGCVDHGIDRAFICYIDGNFRNPSIGKFSLYQFFCLCQAIRIDVAKGDVLYSRSNVRQRELTPNSRTFTTFSLIKCKGNFNVKWPTSTGNQCISAQKAHDGKSIQFVGDQ
jgi:hypothetical protein